MRHATFAVFVGREDEEQEMRRLFSLPMIFGSFAIILGGATSPADGPDDLTRRGNTRIHWQRKADMPEARRNLKIAAVGNEIFALGGYAQPHKGREQGNFCYDIKSDTWSVKKDMHVGRSNFAIASVNGKLYAIGGDKFLDDCEAYRPENDSWFSISPMPTARQHIDGAVIEDRIHVIGGRISWSENSQEALIDAHEVYDTGSDSWNNSAPFPRRAENPSVSAVKGKLYVIDGFDGSLRVYDPEKNVWEDRNKMPSAHFIVGSAIMNDKIFVLDGARPEEDYSRVFVYDTEDDSWSEATSLPVGVKLAGFTSVGGKLFVIGGCDHEFTARSSVFVGEIEE